ncbi:rhodanese-like domain-containing protein [Enterobacteriaceae bacterium ESL0689]|nr:rhodanese-like domain-containing protein [Enterobacteriaceae bacterium ESL0689]
MQEYMPFISRHPVLCIAWVALLIAVLYTTVKGLMSKIKVVTCGQAIHFINKEDAVVVDLRSSDDFRKGHILGAINVLPGDIKANNIGKLEKHKAQPIIVVDSTGMQVQEPASELNKAGFEKVFVLKEGIAGWNSENLPLVSGK